MSTDLIGPVLTGLLSCAAAALDPPVGRVLVAPGLAPAWDECCDGQVWTRLVSIEPLPINSRTSGGSSLYPCGVLMWTATIGVGVLRCASVVDDSGAAPPAAVLTAEALQGTSDAAALAEAVQCCGAALPAVHRMVMIRWDPLGPEGGCAGGEWQVGVAIDNCRCQEP